MKEMTEAYQQWGEQFLKMKTEPMTDLEAQLFISCTTSDMVKQDDSRLKEWESVAHDDPGYQIFKSRGESIGLKTTTGVRMFISALLNSPGESVMWAYGLRVLQLKYSLETIKMEHIAQAFPWGFPTREEMSKVWDAQKIWSIEILKGKVKGDNLLDKITYEEVNDVT